MWRSEWWTDRACDRSAPGGPRPGDIELFLAGQVRQDGRQGSRQQRLAGAGWTTQQEMVPTCGGDLDSEPGIRLSANHRQVGCVRSRGVGRRWATNGGRHRVAGRSHHRLRQRSNAVNVAPCQCRLVDSLSRDNTSQAAASSDESGRKRPAGSTNRSVKGKLSEGDHIARSGWNGASGCEQTECNRKVVRRAHLGEICRGQASAMQMGSGSGLRSLPNSTSCSGSRHSTRG